jgi:RNA polymerase sigma-70 factor (ECF subfamily)
MGKSDGGEQIGLDWGKMKSGDEKSLSRIFIFFYSDLYHYGIKMYAFPDLVKDSIQDVFMRVWDKRHTLGDVQNPKAYLFASLRRKMLLNKKSYFTGISEESVKDKGEQNFLFVPSEFIEINEISEQLRNSMVQSINKLPERQRELVYLRFYFNLRYREISVIMEVNDQTVRNMMQRALSNLRAAVDRELWEGIDDMDQVLMTLFLCFSKKISEPA